MHSIRHPWRRISASPLAELQIPSPGQAKGDELATCLYHAAEKYLAGHKLHTDYSDGDPDKEAGFFILN